jgi:hypothetical protein
MPGPIPREYTLEPKENSISELEAEGFKPANPLINDLSVPSLVQIVPLEVTTLDRHLVR